MGIMEIITDQAIHNVWITRCNKYKRFSYSKPSDLFQIESGDGLLYWKEAWYTKSQLDLIKNSSEYSSIYKNLLENRDDIPDNYLFNDTKSSGCNISHVYQLKILRDYFDVDITKLNNILEFGSGYGSLCKLFYQIGYKNKYHICELNPVNIISQKYLENNNIDLKNINYKPNNNLD